VVASLQAGTDLRGAGKALETIKATRAALAPPEAPARPPPEIAIGVRLRVRSLNQVGVVTALGDSIEVDLGRIRTRVPREGLETLDGTALAAPPAPPPAPPAPPEPERRSRPNDDRAVAHIRTSANTVDLRGMRADEATEVAERFLDGAAHGPDGVTFVLHGHGTGALKRAVRAWLPTCRYVKAWRPADADEGGDAYTVVLLK
jgi:DNA mismatch repair protein MutS2